MAAAAAETEVEREAVDAVRVLDWAEASPETSCQGTAWEKRVGCWDQLRSLDLLLLWGRREHKEEGKINLVLRAADIKTHPS